MNRNHLAGPVLCALLLSACSTGGPPTVAPPAPTVSSSTPTSSQPSLAPTVAPSVSPSATRSPTSTGPFAVLRTDSFEAQFSAERVGVDPAGVIAALTWADQLGGNTVVLRDVGDDETDRELRLYVDHVVQVGDKVTVLRQVKDNVTDCPVDKKLEFVDQALQIRDDDHDNVGEVVFAYRLNCSGDPSSSDLKVLVLEGGNKYILRGRSTNQVDTAIRSPIPEPAPNAWPAGTYRFALALYTEVQLES